MQEIYCSNYDELLTFLENELDYTIEKFIPNTEIKIIKFQKYTMRVLKEVNELNQIIYHNIHCIRTGTHELNGLKEYACHELGNIIFKKINNSKFQPIERYQLTETNFYHFKKKYNIIVLKNSTQTFYENTLIWDWIKIY